MSYESPIKMVVEEIMQERDKALKNEIMMRVNYHVDINWQELQKALEYDRHQYEAGYEDGKHDVKHGYLIHEDDDYWHCSCCEERLMSDEWQAKEVMNEMRYCYKCGAQLLW